MAKATQAERVLDYINTFGSACPLFERDEKRQRNRGEYTDEQFKVLLERWRLL